MKMDKAQMARAFPARGARFDEAIDGALAAIHAEAAREGRAKPRRAAMLRRPALAWAMIACLLLAGTLGVAEGVRRGVFGFLWGEEDVLPEAGKLARQDVVNMTVGGTELAVTQTAYDGATLRLVMSVRVPEIEDVLTLSGMQSGSGAFRQELERDGVTAMDSFDWFTLNGEKYGMTGSSGGESVPGEQVGEALMYFELDLMGIDVPEGDVEIGLPVAVDAQGEAVLMRIPAKASELDSVRDVTPEQAFALDGGGTLTVVSARLSPIAAYATIRLDFPEGAEDAAAVAFASWQHFTFANESGEPVCPYTELTGWGLPQGENDPALHFEASIRCKAAEVYPDSLFLACDGGNAVPLR